MNINPKNNDALSSSLPVGGNSPLANPDGYNGSPLAVSQMDNFPKDNSRKQFLAKISQELDFDLDGDGLTCGGQVSACENTDGDAPGQGERQCIPDGKEIAHETSPAVEDSKETQRSRLQLQESYFKYACEILGWSSQQLTYSILVDDIRDDAWIGKALDTAVYNFAVSTGRSHQEAAYLLSQSPHLQFLLKKELIGEQDVVNYVCEIVGRNQDLTARFK